VLQSFKYKLNELADAARWVLSKTTDFTIIGFEGQMGAGKTTLIQAICYEIGAGDRVASPTYSLVNEYKTSKENYIIYHFDFYRILSEQEAIDAGFYEYIDSGNLCLIEWPQKISNLLSKENVLYINLEIAGENERVLIIN